MINLTDDQKFEAIKYRHEDQAKLLAEMGSISLKILTSFFSLQVAFGGFFSQFEINNLSKMGLLLIDVALSLVCIILLSFNHIRRKEVVQTLENCNSALGFDIPGVYIKDAAINAQAKSRPWF